MTYTIKKGTHRAQGMGWSVTLENKQVARVKFHDNCRYDISYDQLDWNKLFGRSTNGLWHHSNSMRVGWRYNKDIDQIEIGAYTYKKGKRQTEPQGFECSIGFVNIGEDFAISMEHKRWKYIFKLIQFIGPSHEEVTELKMPAKKCPDIMTMSSKLNLYFGGNRTAPHDMDVDIDFLIR